MHVAHLGQRFDVGPRSRLATNLQEPTGEACSPIDGMQNNSGQPHDMKVERLEGSARPFAAEAEVFVAAGQGQRSWNEDADSDRPIAMPEDSDQLA